ncbi:hypothetical protein ADK64_41800 [Streptomyces sp. MMG1121]|nr:hypothetical protein ADK64_41800 [Streptomyces sp. MMG1121]
MRRPRHQARRRAARRTRIRCGPHTRRLFAPSVRRTVLLDQRGSGRSIPHASCHDTDMSVNTAVQLITGPELLRRTAGSR